MKIFQGMFAIVLALWSQASPALADTGAPASHPPSFSSDKSVLSQDDCFEYYYKSFRGPPPPSAPPGAHTGGYYMPFHPDLGKYAKSLDCVRFTYRVDDAIVEGHMVRPKNTGGNRLPVVIYNRGGNDLVGLTNDAMLESIHMKMASQGFIVISSQYRGAHVWDRQGNAMPGRDEFGGRDVDDVLALIPIIDGMPDAEHEQIGMYGFSRGGMMTYLAAKNDKHNRIKAMVVVGGVSDALAPQSYRADMETEVYGRLIPNFNTNREQALRERSVVYWLDEINKSPLLLLHGKSDDRVNVYNAIILKEKLAARGQTVKMVLYPNGDHMLRGYVDTADREIYGWFKHYLTPAKAMATLSSR